MASIAFSLALLVVYAGVKLLIQVKKESLNRVYKYFSWFFIAMGFILMLCICSYKLVSFCHKGEKMMEKRYRMMGGAHSGSTDGMCREHMQGGMMMHGMNRMEGSCGQMMTKECMMSGHMGCCGMHSEDHCDKTERTCGGCKEKMKEVSSESYCEKNDDHKKDSVRKHGNAHEKK